MTQLTICGKGFLPQQVYLILLKIIGDAKSDRYKDALDIVLKDNNVDAGLILLTPQAMTDVDIIAQVATQASANFNKTIVTSFMGDVSVRDAINLLQEHGIPNYPYPERAVRSFARMARYADALNLPEDKPIAFNVDKGGAASILKKAIDAGKTTILEEAKTIIEAYGFKTPQTILAETSNKAVNAAEKLGYPIAMKIASPDIIHKTEDAIFIAIG